MAYNKLPSEFLDLNEMGTQSRGVSVLYGRRADGTLVAVNVGNDGTLASNLTTVGSQFEIKDSTTAAIANVIATPGVPTALAISSVGSTNSFFQDQTALALTGVFQAIAFGFTTYSIALFNDDATHFIEYSFNGVAIHGRLKVGEAMVMDNRAQSSIWLRASTGGPALYRLSSY